MSLLRALQQAGALRALDDALARTLRRLDPSTPDEVLAAAALASLAVANGHAGFDPAAPRQLVDAEIAWPDAHAWMQALAASRFVATPASSSEEAEAAPLVLEHGLLYLRRYREYERRLALQLRRIAARVVPETAIERVAPLFATLFPAAHEGDHQARAAALALRRALLLVTGGPGTGKTTTIAKLLAVRIAQANASQQPTLRIALAAPTGRAADRMADSLRRAVAQMAAHGIEAAWLDALPAQASTLHRLLGTIPDSPRFRHHADNPLPFDVVVVDEASMIDLPLMTKLVEAIATGTRLVLLGDPDQLPSVEAGDVLAAILRAAGDGNGTAADDAEALHPLLGNLPAETIVKTPPTFSGTRVHLHRGYRQSDALHLAPLAAAMREGDAVRALSLLRGNELPGVHFHEDEGDPLHAWQEPLQRYWDALAAAQTPVHALALARRLRLLTAVREGPQGARNLNARIEELLGGATPRGGAPAHFHGRLLLITENSYRHRLFNGDVGICLREEGDGARSTTAWFPGDDPTNPRPFHPAALPAHESAFAMTVHKAQGSEFDEVWLQLPRRDNRVLSRELLYTGITRARHAVHVAGDAAVIEAALSRHASRWSGLAQRLGRSR